MSVLFLTFSLVQMLTYMGTSHRGWWKNIFKGEAGIPCWSWLWTDKPNATVLSPPHIPWCDGQEEWSPQRGDRILCPLPEKPECNQQKVREREKWRRECHEGPSHGPLLQETLLSTLLHHHHHHHHMITVMGWITSPRFIARSPNP